MNHVAVGAVPKGGPLWESCKLMRLSGSYKNGTVHEDICHHARPRFDFVGASTWQAPTDLFFFCWIQAGRLGRTAPYGFIFFCWIQAGRLDRTAPTDLFFSGRQKKINLSHLQWAEYTLK